MTHEQRAREWLGNPVNQDHEVRRLAALLTRVEQEARVKVLSELNLPTWDPLLSATADAGAWVERQRQEARAEEADHWRNKVQVLDDAGCFEVRDDGDGAYWFGGCPGDKDATRWDVGQDLVLSPGSDSWPVGSRVEGWTIRALGREPEGT